MKALKILIFFTLLAICLSACAYSDGTDKKDGILLDGDVLSSIIKDAQDKENSLTANEGDVFWTSSGKIWHKSADCSYLSNSKEIYHGTVDEAMLEGKERACDRCFATEEDKIYLEIENEPIKNGDVFFTRDGASWHSDINCSAICGAEKIYNASPEKASALGKDNSCECNK